MKKTRKKNLPVQLTDAELLVRGQEISDLQRRIELAKEAKKQAAKEAKEEIEYMETKLSDLATELRTKRVYRDVEVIEERSRDEQTGKLVVKTIRTDTHETVDVRPLTDDERQTELAVVEDFHEAKEKKAAAVAGDTEPPKAGKRGKKAKAEPDQDADLED